MERKNNFLIFPYTTQSNPVQGGDKNYPKDTHYCFEIRFLNFCMVLVLFIIWMMQMKKAVWLLKTCNKCWSTSPYSETLQSFSHLFFIYIRLILLESPDDTMMQLDSREGARGPRIYQNCIIIKDIFFCNQEIAGWLRDSEFP